MVISPTGVLHQATVGVTLLPHRSKLVESHWLNQWLTPKIQLGDGVSAVMLSIVILKELINTSGIDAAFHCVVIGATIMAAIYFLVA